LRRGLDSLIHFLFLLSRSPDHRDLHSFPTRRSSDLVSGRGGDRRTARRGVPSVHKRRDSGTGVTNNNTSPSPSGRGLGEGASDRSEEHTSELQSLRHLVCRLLLEKKKKKEINKTSCT